MFLVSSCLAGVECRYDANHCLHERIQDLVKQNKAVIACPEVLGGLPTPRDPAEIQGGNGLDVIEGRAKVITITGQDVTEMYLQGAKKALKLAQEVKATHVVLKENSPSCGSHMIYDGSFRGQKVSGEGVTAALLRQEGFIVMSERDLAHLLLS
ncbi:DUF523 domain-containing protein [Brevibacillus daliensis]|uniref:DUF523 domain-containing protein n=1 Tax=Brevibacillus daliensis TaxID=2892995 RepID=UPI001E6039F3|nr:DUF523 domain-containing protein [Brevibacillus daliensis]